ncbi:PREDICTED: dual specificity protein phosphatase 13-like [Nicrophorus vespilloides]|uniref:Dual specificity protein phosphatase n=1 Tax=Nicrophorus vespilloides TaxID=110193 RepID=A0ABM1MIK9_NICVS|nr:PREDICTED: dual specificity protein phosphatase 13-like [Nicrophorus vespilloides]
MWREQVYSGTLRPRQENEITGTYLDRLLSHMNNTRGFSSEHSTCVSDLHSINKIDIGLYLGDKYAAKDKRFLVKNGITHVLNCAEGSDEYQVNTSEAYYRDAKIHYFGIPGHDRPSWNISVYFESAARFIDAAIRGGGRVLIHCVVGISRSATIVIAYLMICRGMSAAEALQFVFRRRRVFPNEGFLHHIAQLDKVLSKRKLFGPRYY